MNTQKNSPSAAAPLAQGDNVNNESGASKFPADLCRAARVAIAFRIQDLRGPRACAATVLSRYASEWHATKRFNPGLDRAKQIAKRFRLADYYNCLLVEA